MRLATRLVALTSGTVFVTSAVAGVLLLRMERAQLRIDEEAEMRLLARSVQVAVENALRDGQEPDISELLGRMHHVTRQVDVLVYRGDDDRPRLASLGSDGDDALVRQVWLDSRAGDEVLRVFDQGVDPPRLLAGVALRADDGSRVGTLVVTRPLTELQADIRATTMLLVGAVASFGFITTVLLLALLRREVTTPLSRIAAATGVLSRDLDAPLDLPPQSTVELAALQETMALQRQLIAARDDRLAEALQREELERRLRDTDKLNVVGQLAAGVAHEVGSPLQVLIGRARMLAHDATQSDEVRRQAGLIEEHASRIGAIVERLQDVVRRRPSRIRSVDLAEPVRKVVWLVEPEARRRRIALVGDLDTPCPALADPDEVQQVALNLTLNALQAVPAGGRIVVRVKRDGDQASLRVIDDGPGMDDGVRARLFEPFFTTRAAEGGTGLGLAVVRSIVDRHQARIRVDSQPGVGTTIEVRWPGGVHEP